MIKRFCDICAEEVSEKERYAGSESLSVIYTVPNDDDTQPFVEIVIGAVSLNGEWNRGDFHEKCVVLAVSQGRMRT